MAWANQKRRPRQNEADLSRLRGTVLGGCDPPQYPKFPVYASLHLQLPINAAGSRYLRQTRRHFAHLLYNTLLRLLARPRPLHWHPTVIIHAG